MEIPQNDSLLCLKEFLNPKSFVFNTFFQNDQEITSFTLIARKRQSKPICSICLSLVNKACIPDVCTHKFCHLCLKKWKSFKSTCPCCRRKFKKILLIK